MPKKPAPKPSKKPQRKSTKRRKKVEKRKNWFANISAVVLAVFFLVSFGYYLGTQDKQTDTISKQELNPSQIFKDIQTHKVTTKQAIQSNEAGFGIEGMIEKLHANKKKKEQEKKKEPISKKVSTNISAGKRPKLVIIIDDVAQPSQLKAIKSLPFKVTPSIFPPSKSAPNSHKLARGLKHFMVHLPMQSGEAKMNKMSGTLMISDSKQKIQKRVAQIRKIFPNAKFINNHTGSVFTSHYNSMKTLYSALRDKGFVFMDSRTTAKSKVKKVVKSFGDKYIVRDIFLDNLPSQSYIHKQLSQAIRIAKKRGYAIAIGHPHKSTIKALRNAKNMLKGVDVVYMDELYR
ncbi:MAG TPA: divergent polysaccharide deacetylase family protein [Sulfurovum sp.]|nr:divergent polysaccharide deacetylase family protein [Sulfurovum sp.]